MASSSGKGGNGLDEYHTTRWVGSPSFDPVLARSQDALRVQGSLEARQHVRQHLELGHRLLLDVEGSPRDRDARLGIGLEQSAHAPPRAMPLLRILAIEEEDVQSPGHARAAHVFDDVLEAVLAEDAA